MSQTEAARILHVEDNEDDVLIVRELLRARGYDFFWAPTAAEACRLVTTRPFDLVLLDNRLPDGDARSVIRELSTLRPEMPIVVLSGRVDPELAASTRRRSTTGFVLKDEMGGELATVLEDILRPG